MRAWGKPLRMSELQPDWTEPGADRHAWESEFESLLADLEDDPEGVLPELADLVERMLSSLGLLDEAGGTVDQSEHVRAFRAANQLVDQTRAGADLPPGDIAFAIRQLIDVYESVLHDTHAV
jgi:hypothetical protein